MYYRRLNLDIEWVFLFVSFLLLVFSIFWQPSCGTLLAKGFNNFFVLDASKESNVMYITLWSPADANITFNNTKIFVPAGRSRATFPIHDSIVSFCIASADYNDCGYVFTENALKLT